MFMLSGNTCKILASNQKFYFFGLEFKEDILNLHFQLDSNIDICKVFRR